MPDTTCGICGATDHATSDCEQAEDAAVAAEENED